jgi:hypothetical protein
MGAIVARVIGRLWSFALGGFLFESYARKVA